ncbi:hypothetical protein [Dyella caseinilytica]|uniref:Type VI secretion protein n=1 Tax=Dyella caseinilytica TaxID=1849581 RepID=A0ABX7GYJ9_9GAMM|nr:hypothetical protein [Dyella caseinilytica]QRN55023.1 hypothetical protein ISN74_06695 [Dyella caseinilytica]GFZ98763.1 hypothetical protein GCM10011408_19270 [Dyella caseinilytica]
MPIELASDTYEEIPPSPPRVGAWLFLFVVFMAAGVGYTLLTWSGSKPSETPLFWIQLLLLPVAGWLTALVLRLHYYRSHSAYAEATHNVRQQDRERAIAFAREPLAVLRTAYICALGRGHAARRVIGRDVALKSRAFAVDNETLRYSQLPDSDSEDIDQRFHECVVDLLASMKGMLLHLPRNIPLETYLYLPDIKTSGEWLDVWQACWQTLGLGPSDTKLVTNSRGLITLDDWLDLRQSCALEKFTLIVAIQLHEKPAPNSAEAATAMLLAWPPLATRYKLDVEALIHRPVEFSAPDRRDDLRKVLMWGAADASDVHDVWQAGLSEADKPELLRDADNVTLSFSHDGALTGVHDIDAAIGNAGVAASWLAAVLAAEHSSQCGRPVLIACREAHLQMSVVRPAS